MEISTEILIHATPQKIWSILTAFENYPNWNPFITFIEGDISTGNKIIARIAPLGTKAMTFKPKILAFEKDRELRWLGHFLFRGLFDGEHSFKLADNGNGTTTFSQSEKFKGVLVPIFKFQLENKTKEGFTAMNLKLKELAEEL